MKDNRSKMFDCESEIVSLNQISNTAYIHEFYAPEIAKTAFPGHFLQLRIQNQYTPFLARPFSVLKVDRDKGTVFVLYKTFGETTKILSKKLVGEKVNLVGPLGNVFKPEKYKNLLLIGGGIGVPPLYYLTKHFDISDKSVKIFFGAGNKSELFLKDEFDKMNIDITYSTDDGSFGNKELVTIPFERELKNHSNNPETIVMSCGPLPMLKAVQNLALKYNVQAQLSVEAVMACGIGLCQGCIIPKRMNNESEQEYVLVCKEGPIFNEKELVL